MKKAVGFFCAVFISMLTVFLVATGEVSRWFNGEENRTTVRIQRNPPAAESETGSNLLTFDYFDVKKGRINFTIRAEFSQENLPEKLEEMKEIRLSNGVLEIPIHEELKLPGDSSDKADRETPERMSQFVLHFKTALYEKNDAKRHRVFLKDGYGEANDGTEIFFEDLIFRQRGPQGTDGYELATEHPVTIRNTALDLTTPNGLVGSLRNTGLERLTFQPPVSALLGTASAMALGADGENDPSSSTTPDSKLAVVCQGPLDAVFDQGSDPDKAERGLPSRSEIRFQKDVVVYAVPANTDAASIPKPTGTRFECQDLLLELATVPGEGGDRLVPRRMVATWPEGRVKGFFSKGDDDYSIDGETLVWTHGNEVKEGGDSPPGAFLVGGEAVLAGRPTVRLTSGDGLFFAAERALIRPSSDSVVFEKAAGTLTFGEGSVGGGSQRRAGTEGRRPRQRRRDPGHREATRPEYPGTWNMKADEVEFRFAASAEGGRKELAEIEARARDDDETSIVVLESVILGADGVPPETNGSERTDGSETVPPAKASGDNKSTATATPLRVVARQLTYVEAEKKATLWGGPDGKPRLSLGDTWIAARRIHLSSEKGEAVFEGDAHAYVADVEGLGKMRGSTWKQDTARNLPASIEMHAPHLEVGFHAAEQETTNLRLGFLHAYGAPGSSGQVTARSLAEPWFQLTGGEIFWDQLEGQAWLYGDARTPDAEKTTGTETTPALAAEGSPAQIDLEGGSLLAREIHFDQQEWQVFLSDRVTIYTAAGGNSPIVGADGRTRLQPITSGADVLEIRTGTAEVEFFPGFKERVAPLPALGELARVRRVHAVSAPERRIEIRGSGFVGQAHELDWNGEDQVLRFHGGERQEIALLQEDFQGPLYAREVIYNAAQDQIVLRGEVEGKLTQLGSVKSAANAVDGVQIEPESAGPKKEKEPFVWLLETDALEIQTQPLGRRPAGGGGSRFEFVSLRALDKVRIQEKAHGLRFRGDELFYSHEQRKIHVYSPDGRTQLLTRENPQIGEGTRLEDTIQAQEIWVTLTDAPKSVGAAGGPTEWLHVDFERDVLAKFQLASASVRKAVEGVGSQLTIKADRLTLSIDPRHEKPVPDDPDRSGLVPAARARGNVTFESGDFEGSSDLAVYDEEAGELILLGTPARLFRRKRAVSENERIVLKKHGESWSFFD